MCGFVGGHGFQQKLRNLFSPAGRLQNVVPRPDDVLEKGYTRIAALLHFRLLGKHGEFQSFCGSKRNQAQI